MKPSSTNRIWLCVLLALAAFLPGCGGGSEGTGIDVARTISGTVESEDGALLADVEVTLLQTGDTKLTDAAGRFVFSVEKEQTSAEYQLEVNAPMARGTVTVPSTDPEVTKVEVTVVVNTSNGSIAVSDVQIWARIVGDCAQYFDNNAVIRQKREIPHLLKCTLRFFASAAGQRIERVPAQLQVRACAERVWRPLASGKTGVGLEAGVGEIEFDFLDDRRNCEYMLVAPYATLPLSETSIFIRTLTLQKTR